MTDVVVFHSRRGVVGSVRYVDGKLQVKGAVGDMAQNWLNRGQAAKDFVPHYLGWSNGYLIGEPPGAEVSKHLPGMHDQRTHGHRHGVPDFDFGAKQTLLNMIESNHVGTVQFAEQILDLCKTYPTVGRNLQEVMVWHGMIDGHEGTMASAGARYNGWGFNFFPDHTDNIMQQREFRDMVDQVLANIQGDERQPAPVSHIAFAVPKEDFVRSVAVHEFGHLVQSHVFVVHWEQGFGESLMPEEISAILKGHVPKHIRRANGWDDRDEDHLIDPAFAPAHVSEYADASHAEAGAEWFSAAHYGMHGANIDAWKPALQKELDWDGAQWWGVGIKKGVLHMEGDHECSFDRPSVALEVAVRAGLKRNNGGMDISKLVHESLDRSPKKNWVERTGQLPAYIQHIAKDLHEERGMPMDRAIAVAISRCKLWAAGGGGVKPDTKAKAAKAVAEWEALKAKAHAKKG